MAPSCFSQALLGFVPPPQERKRGGGLGFVAPKERKRGGGNIDCAIIQKICIFLRQLRGS